MPIQLFNPAGKRKYVTGDERQVFIQAARAQPRETRSLALLLAYTGCRISEAIALTVDRFAAFP